jgi:hypothetical protein
MNTITSENTDEMRRCEGNDDDELRAAISWLRMGDHVRLTILTGLSFQETLPVRITPIQGSQFHARLGYLPARPHLFPLQADAHITFTAAQIHSIAATHSLLAPFRKERRR